jgi:hypothetical protein
LRLALLEGTGSESANQHTSIVAMLNTSYALNQQPLQLPMLLPQQVTSFSVQQIFDNSSGQITASYSHAPSVTTMLFLPETTGFRLLLSFL